MIRELSYKDLEHYTSIPSLWTGSLQNLKQFHSSQLKLSSIHKDNELSIKIPQRIPLGKQSEHLFKAAITHSSNYELIASHLQIIQHKTTLGELDFILKEQKTNNVIHVELVHKFYCYTPHITARSTELPTVINHELSKYIGPNKKDNLVYKLDKLIHHQLPLLYHPTTRALLADYNIDVNDIQQQVCFKAHIFIPRALWQYDFKYINKRCIAGYYLSYSAFAKAYTANAYYIFKKPEWILPIDYNKAGTTHKEAVKEVENSLSRNFAPLVMMKTDSGYELFFVVK